MQFKYNTLIFAERFLSFWHVHLFYKYNPFNCLKYRIKCLNFISVSFHIPEYHVISNCEGSSDATLQVSLSGSGEKLAVVSCSVSWLICTSNSGLYNMLYTNMLFIGILKIKKGRGMVCDFVFLFSIYVSK